MSAEWRLRNRDPGDDFERPWETPLKPPRHIQHGQQVGGSLHSVASPDNNGFMSAADKAKLDDLWPMTAYNAGTRSTGTFTPDPLNGLSQRAINNGAHTLAPPSTGSGDTVRMILLYTNGASAGAVTTSGFTRVTGTFTTTNTHRFVLEITVIAGSSLLEIKPLQ